MVEQDEKRHIGMWYGSRAYFEMLVRRKALRADRIYFVGDSMGMSNGLSASEIGVIYVATGADKFVRFGTFSQTENVTEDITNIYNILEGKTEIHEYEWDGAFPEEGDEGNLYVASFTGCVYRWDATARKYTIIGGYTAGDGIEIKDGVISVSLNGENNKFFDDIKAYVDNELEQFAETVPHLRYMTEGEVDAIFEEVFDEPYITETR